MLEPTIRTQLERRPAARFARGQLSEADAAREIDTMTSFHSASTARISSELQESLAAMPIEPVTQTFDRADDYVLARISNEIASPMQTLRLDVHPGDTLVGAPFDEDWHVGSGFPFGKTGSLQTANGQGESTSGVAIIVTSQADEDLYVSVSPVHQWSWVWADAHRLASRGGIAMLARRVGDNQPAFIRRATLWNVFGDFLPSAGKFTVLSVPSVVLGGDSGGGVIADAKDMTVGPQQFSWTVGPATFYMAPGERFAVWLWLWQVFSGQQKGFLALQTANVSAFTVSATPPIVVR